MLDQFAEKIKSLLTTGHRHIPPKMRRYGVGNISLSLSLSQPATRMASTKALRFRFTVATNQRTGILRAKAPGMGPLEGAAEPRGASQHI